MKIIKDGNPFPVVFECKVCGCVFEARKGEYQTEYLTQDFDIDFDELLKKHMVRMINKKDVHYLCSCPCCGCTVKRDYE